MQGNLSVEKIIDSLALLMDIHLPTPDHNLEVNEVHSLDFINTDRGTLGFSTGNHQNDPTAVASRTTSPDRRFLPASIKSFEQRK